MAQKPQKPAGAPIAHKPREALATGPNARNHALTAVLTMGAASWLATAFPTLAQTDPTTGLPLAQMLAGGIIGGVVGFLGSVARSFTAELGDQSVADRWGKKLAGWVG